MMFESGIQYLGATRLVIHPAIICAGPAETRLTAPATLSTPSSNRRTVTSEVSPPGKSYNVILLKINIQ